MRIQSVLLGAMLLWACGEDEQPGECPDDTTQCGSECISTVSVGVGGQVSLFLDQSGVPVASLGDYTINVMDNLEVSLFPLSRPLASIDSDEVGPDGTFFVPDVNVTCVTFGMLAITDDTFNLAGRNEFVTTAMPINAERPSGNVTALVQVIDKTTAAALDASLGRGGATALEAGGAIAGVVLGPSLQPVSGARLIGDREMNIEYPSLVTPGPPLSSTDASGVAIVTEVPTSALDFATVTVDGVTGVSYPPSPIGRTQANTITIIPILPGME
jgi:hypothetical protein